MGLTTSDTYNGDKNDGPYWLEYVIVHKMFLNYVTVRPCLTIKAVVTNYLALPLTCLIFLIDT